MSTALSPVSGPNKRTHCSICDDERVALIDAALITGSLRGVAKQFDVGAHVLHSHRIGDHFGRDLRKGFDLRLITRAKSLSERIELLLVESCDILDDARMSKVRVTCPAEECGRSFWHEIPDIKNRVAAAVQVGRTLELIGRVTGEIAANQVQNLFVTLGVRNEAELRSALENSRAAGVASLEELLTESLEAIKFVLAQKPHLKPEVRRVMLRMSEAEVVEDHAGNGTNGGG